MNRPGRLSIIIHTSCFICDHCDKKVIRRDNYHSSKCKLLLCVDRSLSRGHQHRRIQIGKSLFALHVIVDDTKGTQIIMAHVTALDGDDTFTVSSSKFHFESVGP